MSYSRMKHSVLSFETNLNLGVHYKTHSLTARVSWFKFLQLSFCLVVATFSCHLQPHQGGDSQRFVPIHRNRNKLVVDPGHLSFYNNVQQSAFASIDWLYLTPWIRVWALKPRCRIFVLHYKPFQGHFCNLFQRSRVAKMKKSSPQPTPSIYKIYSRHRGGGGGGEHPSWGRRGFNFIMLLM
eukprot:SAG31_NODE_10138_length_1178_cov_101.406858_1_plen_181_part_10